MSQRVTMDWTELNIWIAHSLSGAAIVGTIVGLLPPFAALIAVAWYTIQIYESKTFQSWRRRRRQRQIAKLKAYIDELQTPEK